LYLIYALFAGLVGTAFSVLIRLELSGPGVQYIADNQLYNSIITAHAIIIIFFMAMPAFKGFGLLQPFGLINEFLVYAFRIKTICNLHSLFSIIPFIYSIRIIYVIFCFT
jgi:heme/copper-type cytochrome/quinol oxidase subunit 1